MSTPTGYSGTPLAKKLGITAGMHLVVQNQPVGYEGWLAPLPDDVIFQKRYSKATALVHLFIDRRVVLEQELVRARDNLSTTTIVWISWPKKSSKVPTDISEDVIRDVALPLGFVDIKVCAVNEVWSGLKLVVRKELR